VTTKKVVRWGLRGSRVSIVGTRVFKNGRRENLRWRKKKGAQSSRRGDASTKDRQKGKKELKARSSTSSDRRSPGKPGKNEEKRHLLSAKKSINRRKRYFAILEKKQRREGKRIRNLTKKGEGNSRSDILSVYPQSRKTQGPAGKKNEGSCQTRAWTLRRSAACPHSGGKIDKTWVSGRITGLLKKLRVTNTWGKDFTKGKGDPIPQPLRINHHEEGKLQRAFYFTFRQKKLRVASEEKASALDAAGARGSGVARCAERREGNNPKSTRDATGE